jgi:SSS family solute:Na+ symporter
MTSTVWLSLVVVAAFLVASIALGHLGARYQPNSNRFLNGTGTLPGWVASLSFLACNCGALEVVGLSGITARYGVQAFHFYWVGAIPAMVFMGLVLLPVYVSNEVRSVPEYLGKRFGQGTRLLQACSLLVSTALFAGLCLYMVAQVMQVAAGWSLPVGAGVFAAVVLVYVLRGGFRATVYNEILQFVLMVAGMAPLLYFTHKHRPEAAAAIGQRWHVWQATPVLSGSSSVDLVGVVIGLGFVVSFSYWCTDFVLVQRALSATSLETARRVPIIAGFGKLVFSMLVVLPVLYADGSARIAAGALDRTMPEMIVTLYGPKLFWLGIAALIAGLVNGFASNVAAFSAVWTQEIYRPVLRPGRSERHYIAIGRVAYVMCVMLSLGTAYLTLHFDGLTDFTLFIFSLSLTPFFGVVMVGVLTRRGNGTSAVSSVCAGACVAVLGRFGPAWVPSGSPLSRDFHSAIASFGVAAAVCLMGQRPEGGSEGIIQRKMFPVPRLLWVLSAILMIVCVSLNVWWW